MNKNIVLYFLVALLSIGIVFSDMDDFENAKKIIGDKTPCSQLTETQLESIGDYLMEQMHPGEAHELMDKMMGGEGSESLRQVHIAMAKRLYCNDISGTAQYGTMGMMMSRGMMGYGTNYGGGMMGYGMGYGMMGYGYWGFLNILYLVLAIGLIILVYLWIIKLWREMPKKK